ncbi:TPA: enoyl-CoA hydratase/isomerase family protein [Pseudomonas putida]|nr:enoyl-CoA hydratase/isomerase family protein [Pseudomonas putida]
MSKVSYEVSNGVAILKMCNPPVNSLSFELRKELLMAIEIAGADTAVKAIVLMGDAKGFCAGADLGEFSSAPKSPSQHEIHVVIELSEKPIVAAIHGNCMGGGFELAMCCHYRIATENAKLSLPEVKLGVLPGLGGTQRLPRLVGLEVAANMIVSGEPVAASMLGELGALDLVVPVDELLDSALVFAARIAEVRPVPRASSKKVKYPDYEGYLGFMRNSLRPVSASYPAPLKCLDAIRAAVEKPFKLGLEIEAQIFKELVFTPASIALRHLFFAEREARQIEGLGDDVKPLVIRSVGIIGAGTMGGGIAMNFLNAGIPVKMLELKQEALDKGIQVVRKNYQAQVDKKKLKAEKFEARMALLSGTLEYQSLGDCDLIIEAVFEDMGVKESVFRELDRVAKPGAILASNTSNLDIDKIAAFTKRPESVLGLHFFSPANVMKLLEIVRGEKTSRQALVTAMELAKALRKVAVVAGVCDGFIGNRMIGPYVMAASYLVEEGASPQQVDRALEKFGFAMGPFRMGDLSGGDIGLAIRQRKVLEDPTFQYPKFLDQVAEMGRFGQKTGKGIYLYQGRNALPDPEIDAFLESYRRELGVEPRVISDDEIVSRCLLALANEGAKILEEGVAARASDIDLVYIYGYGFPAHRGGPMHYASSLGLNEVALTLRHIARTARGDRAQWEPARLITILAEQGKSFSSSSHQ